MSAKRALFLLMVSLGVAISIAILAFLVFAAWLAGPRLQATFFPILQATHVADGIHKNETGGICWQTIMRKLHSGTPAYFLYFVSRRSGADQIYTTPVRAYRIDPDTGEHSFLDGPGFTIPHPKGITWKVTYCFDHTDHLRDDQPFTVTGEGEYDVSHKLWRVPVTLPSFFVSSIKELPGEIVSDEVRERNAHEAEERPARIH